MTIPSSPPARYTLGDFDFALPPELIAQHPAAERSGSRLLDGTRRGAGRPRVPRPAGAAARRRPARRQRHARDQGAAVRPKASGGAVEVLVERVLAGPRVLAHLRASKSPKPGSRLRLAEATASTPRCWAAAAPTASLFGLRFPADPLALLERHGHVPLPPYIARDDGADDERRYQTVFAAQPGAVAAPTAALHFDAERARGARARAASSAARSPCTSAPARSSRCAATTSAHRMHREWYRVGADAVAAIARTRARGGRVVAVGTTTLRALESAALASSTGATAARSRRQRRDRDLHHARLPLPRRRPAAHQLPSAEEHAADAGQRVRRPRARAGALPRTRSPSATASSATATRCCCGACGMKRTARDSRVALAAEATCRCLCVAADAKATPRTPRAAACAGFRSIDLRTARRLVASPCSPTRAPRLRFRRRALRSSSRVRYWITRRSAASEKPGRGRLLPVGDAAGAAAPAPAAVDRIHRPRRQARPAARPRPRAGRQDLDRRGRTHLARRHRRGRCAGAARAGDRRPGSRAASHQLKANRLRRQRPGQPSIVGVRRPHACRDDAGEQPVPLPPRSTARRRAPAGWEGTLGAAPAVALQGRPARSPRGLHNSVSFRRSCPGPRCCCRARTRSTTAKRRSRRGAQCPARWRALRLALQERRADSGARLSERPIRTASRPKRGAALAGPCRAAAAARGAGRRGLAPSPASCRRLARLPRRQAPHRRPGARRGGPAAGRSRRAGSTAGRR